MRRLRRLRQLKRVASEVKAASLDLNIGISRKMINIGLLAALAISALIMFSIKYTVFNLKADIRVIEKTMANLEAESYILDAEWTYLINPQRLSRLTKSNLSNNNVVVAKQIKDIEKLRPYYISRSKYINNRNPIASNLDVNKKGTYN